MSAGYTVAAILEMIAAFIALIRNRPRDATVYALMAIAFAVLDLAWRK